MPVCFINPNFTAWQSEQWWIFGMHRRNVESEMMEVAKHELLINLRNSRAQAATWDVLQHHESAEYA